MILPSPQEIDRDGGPVLSPGRAEYINVKQIHALDISLSDLEMACKETAPRPASEPGSWHRVPPRWEDLSVCIWKGSLDVYNPQFVDVECIVSTEVYVDLIRCMNYIPIFTGNSIEHLHEDVLSRFAPMILGVYHPRVLLITTPSFTFNERFVAPDATLGTRQGYPDPTGRTNRIFRHHDHKFEWTIDEFTQWCHTVADEWAYNVEVSGVGKAAEPDPWNRDERLGFASQVAAFTRKEGGDQARLRAEHAASRKLVAQGDDVIQHEMLVKHHHSAHPSARKPGSPASIGDLVKAKMEEWQDPEVSLRQFWFEEDISTLCGGWMELLVAATTKHPELQLVRTEDRWFVKLPGIHLSKVELWGEDNTGETDSHDGSSINTISVMSEDGDEWGQNPTPEDDISTGWGSSDQPASTKEWETSGWSEKQDDTGWGRIDDGSW